ncbi:MAG TPA: NAD-dependent epimerase/dehydratase family protein [Acidimicrobiia bacterium]|nr:NAD-dependent epimerase/dehydratase family protein [Acidimicrobiia bacterium]
MPNKRVLVTGAGGYMASRLVPALAERYILRLADIASPTVFPGVDDVHSVDLTEKHASFGHLFEGIDTVVHLGYRRSSPGGIYDTTVPHIDRFDAELANVRMAYNVYRGALESGVRRVVVASSNHAADWYEHALIHAGSKELVDPTELPLSDNFYGW